MSLSVSHGGMLVYRMIRIFQPSGLIKESSWKQGLYAIES